MKAKESNEINNKELKENIANTALSLLEEGSDYIDLAYTTVQFGCHRQGYSIFCSSGHKYDET